MDSPFVFNKFVTGSNFVTRSRELDTLVERIKKKEHSLIYEPPKSGKRSLVHQVFARLRQDSYNYTLCSINLFNVRTEEALLRSIRTSLINSFASAQAKGATSAHGNSIASAHGNSITNPDSLIRELEEDLMLDQIREMKEYRDLVLNLPEALSAKFNTNVVIYFQEFQELLNFEQSDDTIALLDRVWRTHTHTTYLITGSFVNAMKELFENKKSFYRFAERVKLEKIEERLYTEFIIKNFLKAGRVVSQELASRMYNLTEGHPAYTQQLADIAYDNTRGFLTATLLLESFDQLIELHSYLFQQITSRLTLYQLNLLKAVLDGVVKLSKHEILTEYKFNSSANVVRLKEALQKKEILELDGEKWVFLDPLFKIWLKRVYWGN